MERPAQQHTTRRGAANPISVAELVVRHSGPPAPADALPLGGPPLSVGALMRREGRARHAFDRPLVPRGHSRPPEPPAPPPTYGGRKAAAATGALLAVTAVLGSAVLDEAARQPPANADPGTPGTVGAAPTADGVRSPVRAGHSSGPVTIGFALPLRRQRPSALTGDLPVATGAAIGRGALGLPASPAPAVATPAVQPPPAFLPAAAVPAAGAGDAVIPPVAAVVPVVAVPAPRVATPRISVSTGGGGVVVATGEGGVTTPDLGVGPVTAGPVGVAPTGLTVPDVTLSGGGVTVPTVSTPGVTLPRLAVSPPAVRTPDLSVAGTTVPLPDVIQPAVEVPSVSLAPITGLLGGGS